MTFPSSGQNNATVPTGVWFRHYIPAVLIFCALLSLTTMAWYQARQNETLRDSTRFAQLSEQIEDTITQRLNTYSIMLEQTRGLFNLDVNVTPREFHDYVADMHLSQSHPELEALGYASVLTRGDIEANVNELRKFVGYEEFHISPAPADRVTAITLAEPLEPKNRKILGFDMSSDTALRSTMEAAIQSAGSYLSGTIPLPSTHLQGMILYVPVFKSGVPLATPEDRRSALRGFLFASIRTQDFFHAIFRRRPHFDKAQIDFEIFADGDRDKPLDLLYDHDDILRRSMSTPTSLSQRVQLSVSGRRLAVFLYAHPSFSQGIWLLSPSSSIFLIGLTLTLLLPGMIWLNKRRDEQIAKSERQLRLVTDALPALICYVDRAMLVCFANRAYETWFQGSLETLRGRTLSEAFGKQNKICLQSPILKALDGQTVQMETDLTLPKGGRRPCHLSLIPDLGSNGKVKGMVGLITDISERKYREEQNSFLGETSTLLHVSLESEQTLLRFIESLLPRFADWAAIDLSDSCGDDTYTLTRSAAAHVDPRKTSLVYEAGKSAARAGTTCSSLDIIRSRIPRLDSSVNEEELKQCAADEHHLHLLREIGISSTIGVPLLTGNRVLGVLWVGRSTTDGPLYSKDDLGFVQELGRRAALAIDNARLFQNAQTANRAKDEFLATVSHELRTPLNVILGWLEIIRNEKPDAATIDQALSTMERNTRVQIELINDLLDISRIISGKFTLATKTVNTLEIVDLAVASVSPAARAKAIDLRLHKPTARFIALNADPDRLQQVLWNLLSNAIKFTPAGGRIDVRVTCDEKDVRVDVQDSGQGIEPEFLPHVFERFRQEEVGTTRHHGGLGLGLAIARYLVEMHGGTISAASAGKGHGATFSVILPFAGTMPETAADQCQATVASPNQTDVALSDSSGSTIEKHVASTDQTNVTPFPLVKSESDTGGAQRLRGLDILIVDDSDDVRLLLKRILTKAGAHVHAMATASECLQALKRGIPDILISDIGLPQEDGYSLIRKIRETEKAKGWPRLPAAALTAYAQARDAELARIAGFDKHIAKPVRADDLIQVVVQLVQSRADTHKSGGIPMLDV